MQRLNQQIIKMAEAAKVASKEIAVCSSGQKNKALLAMAKAIIKNKEAIIQANCKDITFAKNLGLSSALIDRLTLSQKRILSMSESLRQIAGLKDPVGEVIKAWRRPNGLLICKVRVPIGVIAIIYESRPSVTCDCIGLCLKSGNSVILRGGKEAINSNIAIFNILNKTAKKCGIPKEAINMIISTDRKAVAVLLGLSGLIDLVMPRGGEGLIKMVSKTSKIPVIKHYKGICHTYVDKDADLKMAQEVAFNAKVQRPAVCNAMETLLVHEKIAGSFLPVMIDRFKKAGVQIRGCPKTRRIVKNIKAAKEMDWVTEYLDLILSVKVVKTLREAIDHINRYGSMHSDAIITRDKKSASLFVEKVDSSCVYVNASTRFTDGGEFGFGAEIGISTEKLHARGPVGLQELTTYKYQIYGNGQVRK